ncbi:hypothetical protein INR49_014674 [Caranx melampygus]|nr:hypothetical protein INR49_014674 [Caranx melampygus]
MWLQEYLLRIHGVLAGRLKFPRYIVLCLPRVTLPDSVSKDSADSGRGSAGSGNPANLGERGCGGQKHGTRRHTETDQEHQDPEAADLRKYPEQGQGAPAGGIPAVQCESLRL